MILSEPRCCIISVLWATQLELPEPDIYATLRLCEGVEENRSRTVRPAGVSAGRRIPGGLRPRGPHPSSQNGKEEKAASLCHDSQILPSLLPKNGLDLQ